MFNLEGHFEEVSAGADRLTEGADFIFHFGVGSIVSWLCNVHVCVMSMSMLVVHVWVGDDATINIRDAGITP